MLIASPSLTSLTAGVVPNARLPQVVGLGTLFYPDSKSKMHGVNVFGHLDFALTQPLYTFGKIAFREEATNKYVKVKEAGVVPRRGRSSPR